MTCGGSNDDWTVLFAADIPDAGRGSHCADAIAVGVATGSFTRAELLDAGASVVLDSLRDFPS